MVSTCGEIRKNTGRAYGGSPRWTFCKKSLQSKVPVVSAIAAMPALPSTPRVRHGEKRLSSHEYHNKRDVLK